jgi:hypothetical protein
MVASLAALIWLWARRAIHYRGIRKAELSVYLANFRKAGDRSRMIVEDEETGRVVVVEKSFRDEAQLVILL